MNSPSIDDLVEERIAQLGAWLEEESPFVQFDQRHLDSGTPEQAYWHLGYRTALVDLLAMTQNAADRNVDKALSPKGAAGA